MAAWRSSRLAATSPSYIRLSSRRIPKGYIPMVLVGDTTETEERILVHVSMLKEPSMVALLDMAEERFGYNQKGVLSIPCDMNHFEKGLIELGFSVETINRLRT
ncbi:hypothetical protein ACP70R_033239 [Stipagrostis hirtigluma subsp. patula]